ncbi:MAG: NUDIX domain-containing protein [Peptostreptococcaceae bacterium]|nr:NUDIX domain-containing protein [Peptostreptococcaceae bacterium]
MELWDIYDVHRNKKGKTMQRGGTFEQGDYHLVVHICVFNSKNEMLIQQRQANKIGFPNRWDFTAGGSATSGDTSQSAAERELFEEIGLRVDMQHKRPQLTINYDFGFDDIYLIEQNVEIESLILQKEEVQAVRWASCEEILHMIAEEEFVPYYPSVVELLFQSRKKFGMLMHLDESKTKKSDKKLR